MSDTPQTDEIETAYQQQRESIGGIIEHARQLERELADKRSQINRLINVIKSRDTDKVYTDKKCNELRDEIVATREQRDALAEALRIIASDGKDQFQWSATKAIELASKALAATKGGCHE
jgi:septal ring factor EnvC (AmiA/AmiB activator)